MKLSTSTISISNEQTTTTTSTTATTMTTTRTTMTRTTTSKVKRVINLLMNTFWQCIVWIGTKIRRYWDDIFGKRLRFRGDDFEHQRSPFLKDSDENIANQGK